MDCFSILGLSRSATKDEVRKAYHELARKYHPDKTKTTSGERMKTINAAYEEALRTVDSSRAHMAYANLKPSHGSSKSGHGSSHSGHSTSHSAHGSSRHGHSTSHAGHGSSRHGHSTSNPAYATSNPAYAAYTSAAPGYAAYQASGSGYASSTPTLVPTASVAGYTVYSTHPNHPSASAYAASALGGSTLGGSAYGGSARGGSARGGSAYGGSAYGGSAYGGSAHGTSSVYASSRGGVSEYGGSRTRGHKSGRSSRRSTSAAPSGIPEWVKRRWEAKKEMVREAEDELSAAIARGGDAEAMEVNLMRKERDLDGFEEEIEKGIKRGDDFSHSNWY